MKVQHREPQSRLLSRQLLSWLLVISGFIWLFWLLRAQGADLLGLLTQSRWQWLGLSLLVGALSILHDAFIFYYLLDQQTRTELGFFQIARLLFGGQLIRHLPGRFWGLLYQINVTRNQIPPLVLVAVNMDLMLIGVAHSLLIPAAILGTAAGYPWLAGLVALVGFSVLGLMLRFNWASQVQQFLPARLARYLAPIRIRPQQSLGEILLILLIVLSHWICYLLAWQLFPLALPQLGHLSALMLCATYTLAWVVGFVTVVTPAGLGVREATFIFFSNTLASQADTAFLALFVRIWLLLIDLLLFVIFAAGGIIFSRRKERLGATLQWPADERLPQPALDQDETGAATAEVPH